MRTELYWIAGPWLGRLAVMPRPRGGDWLEEEIQSWRRSGVDVVVSLLTLEEQSELNLLDEETLCGANSIGFVSFPIVDRGVPSSAEAFSEQVSKLAELLARTEHSVHCRQGIGRRHVFAIGLLNVSGIEPASAIEQVSGGLCCTETPQKAWWITDFAKSLLTAIRSNRVVASKRAQPAVAPRPGPLFS